MLTITTAATDLQLLTIEEMRALAGITGSGSDSTLQALGLKIAASIAAECNVAVGSGGPPTLLRETVTEVFRGVRCRQYLVLSRRHEIEITSVTVDGTELADTEYEVDGESGLLTKLSGDCPVDWSGSKITVIFEAGFPDDEIPHDLKMAASDFFRLAYQEGQRDPALKSEEVEIEGIERIKRDFWVGAVPGQSSEGAVPDVVAGQLQRFRNIVL